jgi:peroxiredoxin
LGWFYLARLRPCVFILAALVAILPASAVVGAEDPSAADLLAAHGIQPVTPPTAAPDFTLPLLAGGEGDLSANHGDWVVLTFFATWCGPCRSEMPTLEKLHRSQGDDGLAVLAVSVDSRRDPVEPFVAEHELTLPVFWDQRGEVGNAYRATSIPVSYVIDPSGQIVGMARGARDWEATGSLFEALRQTLPAMPDSPSRYARLDSLELPEVLEPPTAEWSLPAETPRPGRPFTIEVQLSWSGRLEDYLPQPPQIPLPEGIRRGRVAASSSSLDGSHLVRYQIELTAAEAGVYELDPIELRYLPAVGDGPVAARVAGPTLEVTAAGFAGRSQAALAVLAAGLALAGFWLYRRQRGKAGPATPEPVIWERLREELDRAKTERLAGQAGAGYEALVGVARELEATEERQDLERRLESVRFGGDLPDGAELEAIERRLERALAKRQPDPDKARRQRLRLRPQQSNSPPLTSKEISR